MPRFKDVAWHSEEPAIAVAYDLNSSTTSRVHSFNPTCGQPTTNQGNWAFDASLCRGHFQAGHHSNHIINFILFRSCIDRIVLMAYFTKMPSGARILVTKAMKVVNKGSDGSYLAKKQ